MIVAEKLVCFLPIREECVRLMTLLEDQQGSCLVQEDHVGQLIVLNDKLE